MIDREKVIKGLTHCTAWNGLHEYQPKVGDDCPYVDEADCKLSIMYDALALLKEQEPKPPIVHENSYGWKFYYCPNCEKEFYQNRKQAYCDKCGQAVKWEE